MIIAIIICCVVAVVGIGLSSWPVVGMIRDIQSARRRHDQPTTTKKEPCP